MTDPAVVAIDVGGTSIKSALVARDGSVRRMTSTPTPVGDPDAVVDTIRGTVVDLVDTTTEAIGLVVPGSVDSEAGIASYSANLGWSDVPFRTLLERDTGLPTVLEHDIRAGGLAEHTIGRCREATDSLVVIIGTGVAARVMSGGRFLHGARGLAGEIGHIPVRPDGDPCPCGQRGCLERYASAAAISRRYADRTGQQTTTESLVARLGQDPDADAVWREATEALGLALSTGTMLFDPDLIVLAGGLSRAGDALRDPVQATLSEHVVWRPVPPVQVSSLGAHAGLLGAALLAWRRLGADDFSDWSGEPV